MTTDHATDATLPPPPVPRLPSLADLDVCVKRNYEENGTIARSMALFRRPRSIPGAYWCWLQRWTTGGGLWFRIWAIGLLLLTALMVVDGIFLLFDDDMLFQHGGFILFCWLLLLLPLLIGRRPKLAFAREIVRQNGMICFECGYCLTNLPDEHKCPECGTSYSKADLLRRWVEWMAKRRL